MLTLYSRLFSRKYNSYCPSYPSPCIHLLQVSAREYFVAFKYITRQFRKCHIDSVKQVGRTFSELPRDLHWGSSLAQRTPFGYVEIHDVNLYF